MLGVMQEVGMLVGHTSGVDRQLCWSVIQLGQVGRYVGWLISWVGSQV